MFQTFKSSSSGLEKIKVSYVKIEKIIFKYLNYYYNYIIFKIKINYKIYNNNNYKSTSLDEQKPSL